MKTNATTKPLRIEKESLDSLKFPKQEVLKDKLILAERTKALHHATSLGNLEKHKVLITFEDSEGLKEVYTTIWAVTEHKVLLKAGKLIPVERIHSVLIG